jgi:hypothetical protein
MVDFGKQNCDNIALYIFASIRILLKMRTQYGIFVLYASFKHLDFICGLKCNSDLEIRSISRERCRIQCHKLVECLSRILFRLDLLCFTTFVSRESRVYPSRVRQIHNLIFFFFFCGSTVLCWTLAAFSVS